MWNRDCLVDQVGRVWVPPRCEPPLVSIVLPTRNGSRFIAEAINSILRQRYSDFEVIVVLDGCTDHTKNIVEVFCRQNSRVGMLELSVNVGLPSALNLGFSYSRGQYFTWISDDNVFLPGFLEKMCSALNAEDHDVVVGGTEYVRENGEPYTRWVTQEIEQLPLDNVVASCFMYKRSVHEKLQGYDASFFLAEDYDFFLRAYCAGFRFYVVPEVLFQHRRHGGSLTAVRGGEVERVRDQAILRALGSIPDVPGGMRGKAAVTLLRRYIRRRELVMAVCTFNAGLRYCWCEMARLLWMAMWRKIENLTRALGVRGLAGR